jgi:NAD(P)-dependent dehydrogenase (short-subunit alcohol dehydrogenase family)
VAYIEVSGEDGLPDEAESAVSGRRDEAGEALANELRSLGSEAEYIRADVRKEDDVRNLVEKTVARFGRLDIAVNNAATEGEVGPITEQTAKSFAATFDTNVLGVLLSMKHEVLAIQSQGRGAEPRARFIREMEFSDARGSLDCSYSFQTNTVRYVVCLTETMDGRSIVI